MSSPPLLSVQNLSVQFRTRHGAVEAVKDVSFSLRKGQTIGIVGESGSGKSVTSYAVMRILDRAGVISSGAIVFGGIRLDKASEDVMNELRGREVSMIFQNPRAALNPIRSVGQQISDVLVEHAFATRSTAREKAIEALRRVKIRNPEDRYDAYPFELSGGMCQRVVIAMALACKPQVLIADEPTTGLDVTTQRAVMDLMRDLTRESGMSSILITHDLGLAGEYCDTILVMERGVVVESGEAKQLFSSPQHPYTRKLVKATPHQAQCLRELLSEVPESSLAGTRNAAVGGVPLSDHASITSSVAGSTDNMVPLLDVIELTKSYSKPRSFTDWVKGRQPSPFLAVDRISFQVFSGESVGLVGESGCGKSTTSAMIARLLEPTEGSIWFKGKDVSLIPSERFTESPMREKIQMVFQDPTESLNPRTTAEEAISDSLVHLLGISSRDQVRSEVRRLAMQVGLETELLARLPHQLSGGQKARVGIARALASQPELLILDEPTAALDVSVQAVVLNLLADLKEQFGMSYLFVSHDLEVVRLLCDRVIVMQGGRIVESGLTKEVLQSPQHEYTRTLLSAAPRFLEEAGA